MNANPEIEKAKQSKEAEMKIYTPRRAAQQAYSRAELEHAPVRIYERPYKPNQPTSPLG